MEDAFVLTRSVLKATVAGSDPQRISERFEKAKLLIILTTLLF
jgi:hypothetical protein